MIKRFLCYVSEFFYHTLTPSRARYIPRTRIIIPLPHTFMNTPRVCEAASDRPIGGSSSRGRGFRPADAGRRPRSSRTLSLSLSSTLPLWISRVATRSRRSHRYTVIGFPNRRTSGKTVAFTAVVTEIGQYNFYYLL